MIGHRRRGIVSGVFRGCSWERGDFAWSTMGREILRFLKCLEKNLTNAYMEAGGVQS